MENQKNAPKTSEMPVKIVQSPQIQNEQKLKVKAGKITIIEGK